MPDETPSNPLVSIVIPTYKRPQFLERAITSITQQTHENWELLVVDDNEEESDFRRETEQLMAAYASHPRVRYLKHQKNRGGSAARNTGIENARGEYIAFLDDDDEWLPRKLERQLEVFSRSDDNTAVVYTGYTHVHPGTRTGDVVLPVLKGKVLEGILRRNNVGTTSTILCRRTALFDVGLFDESLPAGQDHDLYIRLAVRFEFDYVKESLVLSHRHEFDKIGKDLTAKVAAFDLIREKHRQLYEHYRASHLFQLKWQIRRLLRIGHTQKARERIQEALKLKPIDGQLLGYLVLSRLGGKLLQPLWKLRRLTRSPKTRF